MDKKQGNKNSILNKNKIVEIDENLVSKKKKESFFRKLLMMLSFKKSS